jgi:hypothetical protein
MEAVQDSQYPFLVEFEADSRVVVRTSFDRQIGLGMVQIVDTMTTQAIFVIATKITCVFAHGLIEIAAAEAPGRVLSI